MLSYMSAIHYQQHCTVTTNHQLLIINHCKLNTWIHLIPNLRPYVSLTFMHYGLSCPSTPFIPSHSFYIMPAMATLSHHSASRECSQCSGDKWLIKADMHKKTDRTVNDDGTDHVQQCLLHLFVDVIVDARGNVLVRCQPVLEVLDSSFVTFRDDL